MLIDWIYDHPLSSFIFMALASFMVCHLGFERFYFFKGIRRLKKRGLSSLQGLQQRKAIHCVSTIPTWVYRLTQLGLIGLCVGLLYFMQSKWHELSVIEATPVLMGKVHSVESSLQKGSRSGSYYVYDHMLEFEKKFQVVRSRKRYGVGTQFPFHRDSEGSLNHWVEHYNRQSLVMAFVVAPLGMFVLYFAAFYLLIYSQVQRATKRRPFAEVKVLATQSRRVKNYWNVDMWFVYDDILHVAIIQNVRKKTADKAENLEGEFIPIYEVKYAVPLFNPRKYLRSIGLSAKQEMKARFFVFERKGF